MEGAENKYRNGIRVIGLTGGVGSGKSYVAELIAKHFPVLYIDTDSISRSQLEPSGIAYQGVVEAFGRDILNEDGTINRGLLGAIVFADPAKLELLNSLTHPYVTGAVLKSVEDAANGGEYKAVLIETAILFQVGYENFCDEVWYVFAEEKDRRKRLKETRGYSDEKIDSIMDDQLSDEKLRELSTVTIDNSDGASLLKQLYVLFEVM